MANTKVLDDVFGKRLQEAFAAAREAKKAKKGVKELVYFHGDYSGPSKAHKKVFNDACEYFGITPRFVDIASEQGMNEAIKHKINAAPAVAVLESGKPVDKYIGGKTHEEVSHFIGKNFGSNGPGAKGNNPRSAPGSTTGGDGGKKPAAGDMRKSAGTLPGVLLTRMRARKYPGGSPDWGAKLSRLHERQGKPAGEVTKEQIKWTLQKHEDRETPEQEKKESVAEQRIEEAAGIHEKHAFWRGFFNS